LELAPFTHGLIGHWAFDDGSGTTASDSSGYGNNGTVSTGLSSVQWVSGKKGGAIDFDGVDDYVDCGNDVLFDSSRPLTVSFWAKLHSYGVAYPLPLILKTEQSTGFNFFYSTRPSYGGFNFGSSSNFVRLRTAGNIGSSFTGVWKHFVMVYDGTDRTANASYKLYLGGIKQSLVNSSAFSATPLINNITTSVSPTCPFYGLIDDVRIYNRALSAAEVEAMYNDY